MTTAIRPRILVGVIAALLVGTGCSGDSSRSTPTTAPGTSAVPAPGAAAPGVTFPPGEAGVWQCRDGRRLRLEGDAQWHYEGSPLNPGGASDPTFIAELFKCHGEAVGR